MPQALITALRRSATLVTAVAAGLLDLLLWNGEDDLRWGGVVPSWLVPLLTLASVAVLLVRGRRPLTTFCVLWIYGCIGLVMPLFAPFAGLILALQNLAARRPLAVAGPSSGVCAVPFTINAVNAGASQPDSSLAATAVAAVAWTVLASGAFSVGRWMYTADRRAELLEELRLRDAQEARRAERLHLARELHDVVAHGVSAIVLTAAAARSDDGRDRDNALQVIEAQGVLALDELGAMLGLLGAEPRGVADVPDLVEAARGSGMNTSLTTEGMPSSLSPAADLAAYRVVQEGLTNARKHGVPGCGVEVRVGWHRDGLEIRVRTTGGTASSVQDRLPASGRGLDGLARRVEDAGGVISVATSSDGHLLCATLPLTRDGAS